MVRTLDKDNSSVGWGVFYMLVNIGGFLGPPLAHFLRGWSWPTVFFGCAAIYSLNYLMLFTYKGVESGAEKRGGPIEIAKITLKNIIKPRLFVFILVMSGFWLMFMQLFDMLPNFIVDWVDTSGIVAALHLPAMMTTETARGTMIAQEWMINIDAGLIVLCVVFISWLNSRMRRLYSILLGICIASLGLFMAGFSMSGVMCIAGIMCFADRRNAGFSEDERIPRRHRPGREEGALHGVRQYAAGHRLGVRIVHGGQGLRRDGRQGQPGAQISGRRIPGIVSGVAADGGVRQAAIGVESECRRCHHVVMDHLSPL